jgi:hypothetical protein
MEKYGKLEKFEKKLKIREKSENKWKNVGKNGKIKNIEKK